MSLADDKHLPTGTYAIINVQYNVAIALNETEGCLSTSNDDYGWTLSLIANKKWTIQNHSEIFVQMPPDVEDGEDVISTKNPPNPHQWVIKRCSGANQSYIIYSPSEPALFWGLQDGDQTTPQLVADSQSDSSRWHFKKITAVITDELFAPAAGNHPTELISKAQNKFVLTIPPGWLTAITSISCGECVNLVRVSRVVDGALEKQDFRSGWDIIDQAMNIDGSDSDSMVFPSTDEAYVLIVQVFHSKNRARKDPLKLPTFRDSTSNLRVISASRPNDMKTVPDFSTFTIFDESDSRTQNAIITIHTSVKVSVDLDDPGKPEPGTVNEGYNEELDLPRPSHMDQWLEKYRPIFVVDDSSAMAVGGAWNRAKDAILQVSTEAMQYDANGIDIYFLNSLLFREGIQDREDVIQIFGRIKPQGQSPFGARLEFVLNLIIDQLDRARNNLADYRKIKPVNIVVLTNSTASDNPNQTIRGAAQRLKEGLHHPNAVSIQFTQVGSDIGVEQAWKKLSADPSLNMVDAVSFGKKFSSTNLQKAVLGAIHPSVRAKVAASSGLQFVYYRVYHDDGAIATKRPAYLDDAYLGRIRSKWVTPPHNAASLKLCLSSMENLDPNKTALFASLSSKLALTDETLIPLRSNQTLGTTPEDPVALISATMPEAQIKPGTEGLVVPPGSQSPLQKRFLYYGVYSDTSASVSKAPIDPEEPWLSKIDLDLIPPPGPISISPLLHILTMKEGISTSAELFAQDGSRPLGDNQISISDANWILGATPDEHIVLKFASQPPALTFKDGVRYRIQNFCTGYSLSANCGMGFSVESPGHNDLGKVCTVKRQSNGDISFRFELNGKWAIVGQPGRSGVENSLCCIGSMTNKDCFFICQDRVSNKVVHDPGDHNGTCRSLSLKDMDPQETRQMWRLIAVP